jgi:hypothetical protein
MKKLFIIIMMIFPALALAQNYRIDWYVIGSGGGHSASGSYQLDGTIGQPIVGQSSSPNYRIDAGFWVGAGPAGPGCPYVPGDVNGNGVANGIDVTYYVSYLKGGPAPPISCDCPPHGALYVAADANGNCATNGIDVTYMVSYFKGGPPLMFCADCPPTMLLAPAPAVIPRLGPKSKDSSSGEQAK